MGLAAKHPGRRDATPGLGGWCENQETVSGTRQALNKGAPVAHPPGRSAGALRAPSRVYESVPLAILQRLNNDKIQFLKILNSKKRKKKKRKAL